MANLFAIHSVGASLVAYLRNSYPGELRDEHPCDFRLLSSGELAGLDDVPTTVSLYLYRVTINEHLRVQRDPSVPGAAVPPLALDLHLLLTVWADDPVAEHAICAWVMRELHTHPIMDVSSLSPDGGWRADEVVQIIPAELSNEDMMRIWDALSPPYHLSLSYTARVVRIDPLVDAEHPPVVATRHQYGGTEAVADG